MKALTYFSEYLVPDIIKYHKVIIPALTNSFNDLNKLVSEKAMIAVDIFCGNMEPEEISLYLE